MIAITRDQVIGIVCQHESISMRGIQLELGIEHSGKLSSLLTQMLRDESIKRVKGRYAINAGMTDNCGRSAKTRRELLPTDKVAIKERERRKANMKTSEVSTTRSISHTPIATLEDAEQAADSIRERDQRIRDAIQRLKLKSNFRVDPVADLEFKIEILDGIGSADPILWDLLKEVIADLRRLDELSVGPF